MAVFEIGYSGNQGRKFPYEQTRNFNQMPSSFLAMGEELNNRVPNPFFGLIPSGPTERKDHPAAPSVAAASLVQSSQSPAERQGRLRKV